MLEKFNWIYSINLFSSSDLFEHLMWFDDFKIFMMKVDYKIETVNFIDIILLNELNVVNIIIFVDDFILNRWLSILRIEREIEIIILVIHISL